MELKKIPNFPFEFISLPPADLKVIRRKGVLRVYDPLRKNFFCLTEEEFVRQTFVAWLIRDLGYPPSLMNNEIGLRLNDTYKRCDTVIFNPSGDPLMIVEYKSPKVKITQEVFDQIVRYNMVLNARFLTVSNGMTHYCCLVDREKNNYTFLREVPNYSFIKNFFQTNKDESKSNI